MSLEGLLVALVLAGIVIAIVGRPFFSVPETEQVSLSRQRLRAEAYYERVVRNIRDLDDDHTTGKIATDEYTAEREQWVQRGSVVLKLLDDLETTPLTAAHADDAAIDAAIEKAVKNVAGHTAAPVA